MQTAIHVAAKLWQMSNLLRCSSTLASSPLRSWTALFRISSWSGSILVAAIPAAGLQLLCSTARE